MYFAVPDNLTLKTYLKGTLGDIILEEIDGVRTDAAMDLRDTETKIGRAVLELANRLDRTELRCSVNQKDVKANKTFVHDYLGVANKIREEMGDIREAERKHHAQHDRDKEQLKMDIASMSNRLARLEASTKEQINDIQGRVGMYLQSLEMQLAEVLERLAARVVEVERFQQRQARVHHDVLDAIADLRLQIHREGIVMAGVPKVASTIEIEK